jgi:sulfofructose kinase
VSTTEFDVVCVGAANLDTIVTVDRVPADDERMTTDRFVTAGGGPAATAAVALARLGARVAVCAVVGADPEGELVRELLEREDVDTRWIRVDPAVQTARAIILASRATGGRSIVTTVAALPTADDVPVGVSEWIHVDQTGYAGVRRALQGAGTKPRLSIDGGNPIADLLLAGTALFAPTLSALLARYDTRDAERALRAAHDEGAEVVVATAGSDGTYVLTEDGATHVASYPVEVVSTLGAGDVFHGALLASLVQGRDVLDAVSDANAAAAMACSALDGRAGIPTRSSLSAFLSSNERDGR